ncbi:MAG: DNA-binding protein [Thaumarchaeota archaeon]|jgi:programmed cell death protein 5|nr:DNA-binding protein [Candidatus Geocrenenecus arthurdayi]MCL7388379.1 DNA-binding protein [Candidatus Geocrenenecus arthurdayi]MCL7390708.1 DNA-binding protein [Candidatus Geocrenenecus arthurdayi]MCL7395836.1 DNA-binding protein [Candidatus Geocrenenecus arthurdayi]MCL7402895.1 DNA-binding protein [Candidatus Geocrenenecus arthurdayi]
MAIPVDEDELEKIRMKKMMELQQKAAEEEKKRREAEKAAALRIILTPEARQRLANLRLVRRELVEQLEEQLIRLAQAGRISIPITDEVLKEILKKLDSERRREIRIIRK